MKVSVIASTNNGDKILADYSGSKAAAVCYMRDTFETIATEDIEKTKRRVTLTKESGHHSVYDHFHITLLLEDVPKLLAMLLNNENDYTTSEKSGRYTKMSADGKEKVLYDKWLEIFKAKITERYNKEPYVMKAVEKLAQENARYLLSILSPATTMVHTVSYRQFNVLYSFAKRMQNEKHALAVALKSTLKDFCKQLEATGFVDDKLVEKANERTGFSLIEKDCIRPEYFGDVYCMNYKATFAIMAHLHRHRTIYYSISLPEKTEFYIPEILRDDEELVTKWLCDMKLVEKNFPNGMLVNVNERGTIEKFILKTKLRHCARAQLEICNLTLNLAKRYYENGDERIKAKLAPYLKMRCKFHDFKCKEPCAFADGIKGTRVI